MLRKLDKYAIVENADSVRGSSPVIRFLWVSSCKVDSISGAGPFKWSFGSVSQYADMTRERRIPVWLDCDPGELP